MAGFECLSESGSKVAFTFGSEVEGDVSLGVHVDGEDFPSRECGDAGEVGDDAGFVDASFAVGYGNHVADHV